MKLVTIQYPDSVDLSLMPKGTVVTVSDGTTNLPNGIVMSLADVLDPDPIDHSHTAIISPPV